MKMNKQEFWKIISKIDWSREEDEDRLEPVIDYLSKLEVNDIREFDEILAEKLYNLDGIEYAKNIAPEDAYGNPEGYFSVDYFLYIRCCVVANGQDYYNSVLHAPSTMPKGVDYEPLLYVGIEAFERKTGKDSDSYYDNWNMRFSFETYSNEEKWKNS